jgi:Undecaprenyl-phosphate galactose phosphotransferase WbaP
VIHRTWPTRLCLVLTDAAAISAATALAVLLRWWAGGHYQPADYLHLVPGIALFLAVLWREGLYADLPPNPADELRRIAAGVTVAFLVLAAGTFLLRGAERYSRTVFFLAWAFSLAAVPVARGCLRHLCARRAWWGLPVIVLGAGRTAEMLIRALQRNPGLGLKAVALVDDDPAKLGTTVNGVPVVGAVAEAPERAAALGVRCAVAAMPGAEPQRLLQLWRDLGPRFPHLVVIPGLFGFASLWVEAKDLGGILGLEVRQSLLMAGPRAAKRLLDLALVLLFLPFLGLLVLAFAVLIRCDGRGPVFYSQRRLGRDGREFPAWKFRTMRPDADQVLAEVLARDPALRAEWERDHKLRDDPRVTRVGRILRVTSLDELPQLWNVLAGQMSLVGPRPIVQAEVAKYGEFYPLYQRVRPGITGLWQVSGRNNTTYEERVGLDAYYVRNWSPWLDLWILARTVKTVVLREGAY